MKFINTYKEFSSGSSSILNVKQLLRNYALQILSLKSDITKTDNWVRFPYYHHVFDDEKLDFERQMKYLRNFGEFISIDDACSLINGKEKIDGRYFCVSFDDGYHCCSTNMLDVTSSMDIPVIIYLPTNFISLNPDLPNDYDLLKLNSPKNSTNIIPILSWEECRSMLSYNVSFGSHTMSHANLINLSDNELMYELKSSKNKIESELNVPCIHFACPWGKVNANFKPEIVNPLLKELGYKSFATTHRGLNNNQSDLFFLKRDHLLAEWGNSHLKYFFSR